MPATPIVTKLIRVHGRVQGVYFRESMCMKAAELGVRGWVRNRHDGTVEALVQGGEEAVRRVLAWARIGPASARVEGMSVEEGSGSYVRFERRDTV
jgi:acylphosphatase